MKGKIRIQLKQGWFIRPYPIRLDGMTIGVLTPKNPEVQFEIHPGIHHLDIRYHGKWISYPIEVKREFEILHFHVLDNGLRFQKPTSRGAFSQIAFACCFLLFLWGYFQENWSLEIPTLLLFWLIWQGYCEKTGYMSLELKRFNPSSDRTFNSANVPLISIQ